MIIGVGKSKDDKIIYPQFLLCVEFDHEEFPNSKVISSKYCFVWADENERIFSIIAEVDFDKWIDFVAGYGKSKLQSDFYEDSSGFKGFREINNNLWRHGCKEAFAAYEELLVAYYEANYDNS